MPSSASRAGRRPDPTTRQRWQPLLDRFRRRGLPVPTFCERERISTASFYVWGRRSPAASASSAVDELGLVRVRVVTPTAPSAGPALT